MTTILRPNFEEPLNTAQQLVDNNITMFGYPGGYQQWQFNTSHDPALKNLGVTFHVAETWDEYSDDFEYYIHTKGTHAVAFNYLSPLELELGRWWKSTDHIPGINPYGAWLLRRNWHLTEVLFTVIFLFSVSETNFY